MTDDANAFDKSSFRRPHKKWLGAASEVVAPVLRLAARGISRHGLSAPSEWRRGLILSHNHIGDVLYRTCSLPVLRSALPNCEWSFLTSPASHQVVERNPALNEVLPWNDGENSWSLTSGSFGELRNRKFDVALCTNSLRYYPDLFLASALGIPNRVAFTHKGLSGLVTHPVHPAFPDSYASYFRSMVSAVTGVSGDWPLRPRIFPDTIDDARASKIRDQYGLDATTPVIACSLTTRQRTGNFPAGKLLAILEETRRRMPLRVAFFGTRDDRDVLAEAGDRLGKDCVVIAGDLGIPALASFLGHCSALLTLDSGPRHLGNAANIPVFFARNMSHSQVEAGKYCESETDIAPVGEYMSDEAIAEAARQVSASDIARRLLSAIGAAEQRA